MLTATQREQCRRIAEALDRGDNDAYKRAEDSLTPEMKGQIWAERKYVKAQVERRGNLGPIAPKFGERTADLDYWPEIAGQDDDDDDDPDDLPVCPDCRGSGKDAAGNVCTACKGTGKVPADDDDQDDDGQED